MTAGRVRVSEIAEEVGADFPELLFTFWKTCPEVVDDNLTVPASLLDLVREESTKERQPA